MTLKHTSRIWLALLLLGLLSLGEIAVVWHETQLEAHASGAACDACVVVKPFKHAAASSVPSALILLTISDIAPEITIHPPLMAAPQRSYHSRAPPCLV